MGSVNAFVQLRKLLAMLAILAALYGMTASFGFSGLIEQAHAADVCDGTCG